MNQTQGNSKEVGTPRYLSLVVPLRKVGDEAVHKELGDRMERAATTASSSEAEQDSGSGPRCQDTILGDVDAQTRFETTSEQSNDPPLSKVNTFGSGEDSMKILELMEIVHNCLHCYLWDEIEVNAGSSNLLLLVSVNAARHQLLLLVQVPAAEGDSINTSIKGFTYFFIRFHSFKHSLNISPNSISSLIIKIIIMSSPKFAETHNVVAFLEKPAESDGFAEIIDFLKASSVSYALTVNPIIYTSCIQQFWATAQVKMVNGVRQLQALIDKKKVIITEASIRNDLHLDDAEGTDCLPNTTIFEELAKMGYEKPSQKLTFYKAFFSPQWKFMIHTITQSLSAKSTAWNEFSSTMASLIICLATNRKFNLSKYIFDAMVKHLDGGVKFLMYPRFLQIFINQQLKDMSHHKKTFVNPFHTKKIFANIKREVGEDSIPPTDSTQIPIIDQPSTSYQPKKKQKSRRKQRKEAETAHAKTEEEEHFNTPSNNLLPSEKAKSDQAIEIASLKKRVDKLEKRRRLRTTRLTRFKKLGTARRVKSSNAGLGAKEDASKQGRSIKDIDADDEVTLVNEQQNEDLMFDTRVLDDDEVFVDVASSEKNEQSSKLDDSTASEAVTTVSVEDSDALTIQVSTADIGEVTAAKINELTLHQTLIEIKAAKLKVVTTAATTTTTTRPKGKGVVLQEPSEFRVPQESQPSISKDKGKCIMVEPEVPLKRKDQITLDEQIARDIQSVIQRLVWGATVYFIWQERNIRLFRNGGRSGEELFNVIFESVRSRLMGLKLKVTPDVINAAEVWKFPIDKMYKYRNLLNELIFSPETYGNSLEFMVSSKAAIQGFACEGFLMRQGSWVIIYLMFILFMDCTRGMDNGWHRYGSMSSCLRFLAYGDVLNYVGEVSSSSSPQESQPLISKDKGKGIMVELEVPLKRKDQIALDEQIARDIQAKLDQSNTQAMMEADRLLAERLQSKEREELTDEEKGKLFMELMEKRRKHFVALKAQEKRNRTYQGTKKRNQNVLILSHGWIHHYKTAERERILLKFKLFDKEMEEDALGRKRAGKQQQQESLKKQKMEEDKESDEVEEVSEDDEGELLKHLVIKKDEDIAIDAIPLATKLPVIVDYKLHKEGMLVHYQLIRADGSSKRYSSMIRMLQGIDREDLEVLWRIVKAKHNDTRPEDEFERVLWGDLKVMFEPDTTSDVWRMLQGYRVTIWKLIDSSGVHFVSRKVNERFECIPPEYDEEFVIKKLEDSEAEHQSKVTTVSIKISTAGTYYCLCSVSAAGYKDTTVADLQLLEDLLLSRG
ncbi:hypothetical protein Tco_0693152 [Tanacetum coccineum]